MFSNTYCQTINITSVGIAEANALMNISIYPNPATDQVTISFAGAQREKKWSLKLVDVLGNMVSERIADHASFCKWNLDGVAPGAYNILLQNGNEQMMK